MNEPLKEIYGKALDKAAPHTWHSLSADEVEKVMQVFGELLVRECATIAGKAEYSDTWIEPVEDTIKKHFGVDQ